MTVPKLVGLLVAVIVISFCGCSREEEPAPLPAGEASTQPINPVTQPANPSTRPAGLALNIRVTDLRNNKGKVLVLLFNQKDGFPGKKAKALAGATLAIEAGQASGQFPNLKAGQYAVVVYHDENNNGKLDTNILGLPTEGVGASRRTSLGMPSFDDCKFEVNESNTEQQIPVRYL